MINDWILQIALLFVSLLGGSVVWYLIAKGSYKGALIWGWAAAVILITVIALYIRNDLIARENKAEDTAKRPSRAYVSVGPLIVKEKFPKEISFVAKNTGQTPAYDMSSHLNFEKTGAEVGLPDGFGFPIRDGFTLGRSVATLASNGEIEFTFPVDLEDLTKVQNGKMGLFYYGHISYKDIFKKDHVSKLCYQYTGAKQGDVIVHEFRMCENHNDAD